MSKSILIIEDDDVIAKSVQTALDGDYDLYHALTGTAGLELAKEKVPDLIILDYMLPDTDGLAVLHQIKEDHKLAEVPVVVLTNRTDSDTVSNILGAGGKEFWSKTDLSLDDIVVKVREILGE